MTAPQTRRGDPGHHPEVPSNQLPPATRSPASSVAPTTDIPLGVTREWWVQATAVVRDAALSGFAFDASVLAQAGVPAPTDFRHVGALFSACSRSRVIEPTGRAVMTVRPDGRHVPSRVWVGTVAFRRQNRSAALGAVGVDGDS